MEYLDGEFVIPTDRFILTSKTGTTWQKQEFGDPNIHGFESVIYGNGIYTLGSASGPALDQLIFRDTNMRVGPRPLAFGNDLFIGTGLTWSENGIDWNTIPLENSWDIRDVVYTNGRFVGVGYDEAAAYSLDGKNWIKADVLPNGEFFEADFTSVAFGNGKFVAPVYDLARIGVYQSEDGSSWTFVPSNFSEVTPDSGFSFSQGEIAFWDGRFYISGGNSVYVSENLTTWTTQESIYHCQGLTATPSAIFGVGREGVFRIGERSGSPPILVFKIPGQIIAESGDAVEVEVDAFDLDGSISSVMFLVDGNPIREVTESPYRFSWTIPDWGSYTIKATATDSSEDFSSIAKIVRATKRTSITLQPSNLDLRRDKVATLKYSGYLLTHLGSLYRKDRMGAWQIAYQFPSGNFISLHTFKNVLIANSDEGIYSTTDGIGWNYHEVPNEDFSGLYQFSDVLVSGYNSDFRYISLDGLNWRRVSIDGLQFIDSILGAYNGYLIAQSRRDGKYLIESGDGDWVEKVLPAGEILRGVIAHKDSLIIWVSAYEQNTIRTRYYQTTDLSEWQEFFPPYVDFSTGAFFANGFFFAIGSNGGSYTTDFVNWNQLPISGRVYDIIRFSGELFLATERGIYRSSNGFDWVIANRQSRSESSFRVLGNNLYLMDSFGALETTDGINWSYQHKDDSESLESELMSIAHGSSGYLGLAPELIARSQDGLNWEFKSKPSFLGNSVTFGKGNYLSFTESGEVAVSQDGSQWELIKLVDEGEIWSPKSIHYLESSGLFLLDNFDYYFTSTDGYEWLIRNFPEDNTVNLKQVGGVIFGRTQIRDFRGGDTFATLDGINWQTLPEIGPSDYIFFQNGIYLAGGKDKDIPLLKSENGFDWTLIDTPVSGIGDPQYIDQNGFYIAFGRYPYYERYFFTGDGKEWIELLPFDNVGAVFSVNNRIFYSHPQLQLASSADLRLSNIILGGDTFGIGDSIHATLNISNLGSSSVDLSGIEVWSTLVKNEGWDGNNQLKPTILNSVAIGAGESSAVPIAIEIPRGIPPGNYGLQVWLNPTQIYPETTAQNNYAWSGGIQVNIPSVSLSLQSSPGGSVFSVPAKDAYALGDSVSLVAVTLPKFRLRSWEGVDFSNAETATVILEDDTIASAEFERVYYPEIAILGGGKVYIQPDKPYFLTSDQITVSAVPDSNWIFNEWLGPLNGINPVESFEIQSDIILSAIFVQSLEGWKASTFSVEELGDESTSGDDADADSDGFNTTMEFYFGTDPLDRTNSPDIHTLSTGNLLIFSFQQSVSAVGYELLVEESPDLDSWYPVPSEYDILRVDSDAVFCETSVELTNNTNTFFRLRLVEKEN